MVVDMTDREKQLMIEAITALKMASLKLEGIIKQVDVNIKGVKT
jgi:hypothetical protein